LANCCTSINCSPVEAGYEYLAPGFGGNQQARRAHERIDDVADAERELLHMAGDAGVDNQFVQLDLCLLEGGIGAGLLCRQ
jgi:hypothetical protein